MADEFLPKGTLIVSMRGRNPAYNRDFYASRNGQYGKPAPGYYDQSGNSQCLGNCGRGHYGQ